MPGKPGFFSELKRRHIWRVAIAYAVAGWLLVQIATQVLPVFHMPDWTPQLVVILVAIGFPFALVLAWAFEFTPGGIRRTEPADSPNARPVAGGHAAGHKFNTVVITLLIIAVALLGWRLLALRRPPAAAVATTPGAPAPPRSSAAPPSIDATRAASVAPVPAAFHPPANSIMVLPFSNLGNDPKQAYFSDGVTQELTSALGQNTGLVVIAWNTASRYATSKQAPSEIGRALNVAHILAGSIQRDGQRIRVSAELIDTANGRQLWSAHYDDTLTNIFAVQDKISAAIADALQVKFAGMRSAPTRSPEAHELYLKGLVALDRATAPDAQAAQDHFRQALKLDPDYADAWAGLAQTWVWLSLYSTLPLADAAPQTRAAADKALALDPDNVRALVAVAGIDLTEGKTAEATAKFVRAIDLDPSNAAARQGYGLTLPPEQALIQFQEAVRLDPQYAMAQTTLSFGYLDQGDWARAVTAGQAWNKTAPRNLDAAFLLAFAFTQMNRGGDAIKAFDLVEPATALDRQLVDAGRMTYRALLEPGLRDQAVGLLERLRKADMSPVGRVELVQLFLALGEKAPTRELLEAFCKGAPIGCRDLAINPIYAPLRGDPDFEKLVRRYAPATPGSGPAASR